MSLREIKFGNASRGEKTKHPSFDQGTHRKKVNGGSRRKKTATQGKNDVMFTIGITKLDISSTESSERTTVRSPNGNSLLSVRVEKRTISDDVMSTT